jgi:hypothetical protein
MSGQARTPVGLLFQQDFSFAYQYLAPFAVKDSCRFIRDARGKPQRSLIWFAQARAG